MLLISAYIDTRISVEVLNLNPNCSVNNMLFIDKWLYSLLYKTFSKILENTEIMKLAYNWGNCDLSLFLYIGLISEYFNLSGNVPVASILLHICVNGDTMNGLTVFKIFVVTLLYPHEFLFFSCIIIFSISPVVVFFSFMLVKGCWNAEYR